MFASEKHLPADLLGLVFDYVLSPPYANPRDADDQCPLCLKLMALFFSGRQASALRGVCKRWRDVFTSHVILRSLQQRPIPWCVYPQECVRRYSRWLRDQARRRNSRVSLHVLPRDINADLDVPSAHPFIVQRSARFLVLEPESWSEELSESSDDTAE